MEDDKMKNQTMESEEATCDKGFREEKENTISEEMPKRELTAGDVMDKFFAIAHWFYFIMALVGIAAYYLLGRPKILYIITAVLVAISVIQFVVGWVYSRLGILLVPIGAGAGFYYIGGLHGGCIGILLAFVVRHIVRDIIWKAIYRIFR